MGTNKRQLTIFQKAIYWYDYTDEANMKLDFARQVLSPCADNNIILAGCSYYDLPTALEQTFDVLFFDWGGMSLGNSMMESFCRYIIKHAQDNGSRYYVMVSSMTEAAMKDALNTFGEDKPLNVFLSIKDLAIFLDKLEEVKCRRKKLN